MCIRDSLRTHNLKPKKGAQAMRKNEKITDVYKRQLFVQKKSVPKDTVSFSMIRKEKWRMPTEF